MLLLLYRGPWLVLLLALLSCHDAPRTNPFDPALTPPVELQVALDDTAGTATLTWTRYEGQQPFHEYRILRNIADRKSVDTLAQIPTVAQTAFVDTTLTPSTAYVYRVAVVNAAGYETSSEERSVTGFSVGGVRLLGVENDQDSGGLALRWSRYVGPDFHGYQLKRRVVGTDREEVLAEISAVAETSFVDVGVENGQGYAYLVLVLAGREHLQSNSAESQLVLPPVQITRADFSSTTASASLTWTQYRGARFKGYQVLRRVEGSTPQVIREVPALADTSFVDSDLSGNTEYFYQVVVVTERDEELPSAEQSGRFHALVATWPLGGDVQPRGRLYVEPGDRIVALVYRETRPWILSFDPEGQLLDEWMVPVVPPFNENFTVTDVVASLGPGGGRFLGLSVQDNLGILSFTPDGQPVVQERTLFTDAFPNLSEAEKVVRGEIALVGNAYAGFVNKVRVSADGRELFFEDFEEWPEGNLSGKLPHDWQVEGGNVLVEQRAIRVNSNTRMTHTGETWQNFRLEADIASYFENPTASIQIGGDSDSRFSLRLNLSAQQALLDWEFAPPAELALEPQGKHLETPLQIMTNVIYGLSLEAVDGVVNAALEDPMLWVSHDTWLSTTPSYGWSSLALVGDILAFTRNDQIYNIDQAGEVVSQFTFGAPIGEIRVWENPKDGAQWVGVCVPDFDGVLVNRVSASNPSNWPRLVGRNTANVIGPALGSSVGTLLYPISFAVGPDGRFYVLDAGNARIAVFDANRKYLTQWGHRGNSAGDFDFGKGTKPLGLERYFAGSIAVDSQGYIYVLDVFNKRIQKFAP